MSSIKWVLFTKRTNYPKLGCLIARCRTKGIKTRIISRSWHAPILEVPSSKLKRAWKLLPGYFDNMADDDPQFIGCELVMPDILDSEAL